MCWSRCVKFLFNVASSRRRIECGVSSGNKLKSGLARYDLGEHVRYRVRIKRLPGRQHFVEHATEGPDVRAAIDFFASRLLR